MPILFKIAGTKRARRTNMITYIDTEQLIQLAREIDEISSNYSTELNKIYTRLCDVPTISKEWVGQKAEYYFKDAQEEKAQCDRFIQALSNITNEMRLIASESEQTIESNMG